MMRSDRRAVLLAVALSLATSPLFAAAGSAKAPPRLSEEQARQKAAAVAKALGFEWDKSAPARLGGSTWSIGPRFSEIKINDDTGRVVEVHRPYVPRPPGTKPVAKEQAVATATRLLEVVGMPPDAKLREPELDGLAWGFRCGRQTPQGIPYDGEVAALSVGPVGQIQVAFLRWSPAPPPKSTEVKVTKEQAVQAAKDFVKRARRPGSYDQFIEAALRVVQPNDHHTAPRPTADATTPTRVAWAVSFPRPLSGSLTTRRSGRPRQGADWVRDVVWIDAANAEVLGGKTVPAGPPPAEAIHRVVAHRRWRGASVAGAIAAAALVVGLVVWARRRRPVTQGS